MTPLRLVVTAAAAGALVVAGAAAPESVAPTQAHAAARAAGRAPARPAPRTLVGVGLREWNLAIYRRTVTAGRVRLSARNYGEDPHDVAVRGPHGYRSRASSLLRPGAVGTLDVTLTRPGTYRLVCTLPGHEQQGMAATLRVVRPPKRRRG